MGRPWIWFCAAAAFTAAARLYLGVAWAWVDVMETWPAADGRWGDPEIRVLQAVGSVTLSVFCAVCSGVIGVLSLRSTVRDVPGE